MGEKSAITIPKSETGILRKFLRARQMKLAAEKVTKALHPLVVAIVKAAPEQCRQFGLATLKIIPVAGAKIFNVEKALEKLGKSKLKPFWKVETVFDVEAATKALGKEALAPFWEELEGSERLHIS